MRKVQKLAIFFATLLTGSVFMACNPFTPDSSSEMPNYSESDGGSLDNSSFGDSSSSDSGWSSDGNSSSDSSDLPIVPPTPDPQWEIVDMAYELEIGERLDGTFTLTGKVTETGKKSGKNTLTIVVAGREEYPIYCFGITGEGVSAVRVGDTVTVEGSLYNYQGTIEFDKGCVLLSGGSAPPVGDDPYANMTESQFYANYSVASSNTDAYYRSLHGFMSGELTVPDQAPTVAKNRPTDGGKFIRNSEMNFSEDGNAYTVMTATGEEAFTVYREGAYITLEEVAAFVYAFGTHPVNHVTSKSTSPSNSEWGEYLRLNYTKFSGDTSRYPYEPVLPNVSGCGGTLTYYEMDIGTTGTDCDPSYPSKLYNNGSSITRGAARIVHGKTDLNGNGVYEQNEHHLFYTYNHYNDFQEYLNYEGGWGEIFGNITGGGSISSTSNYNPTSYVEISLQPLPSLLSLATIRADDYRWRLTSYI